MTILEIELFLCSMLGEHSELNVCVVRDVLRECGYEVEKALNALLELSSASNQSSAESHQSYAEVLAGRSSEAQPITSSDVLSQTVLTSLFSNSASSSPTKEKLRTVNWKHLVDELQESLGEDRDVAKGKEYEACRGTTKKHWDSTASHYQKSATAYSSGSRAYAGYLSDQAKTKAKRAREEEEKASQEIFRARNKNKGIQNDVITIDLHGQHVKEAMKIFKIHLMYGRNERSLRLLRVITGCGGGKSVVKDSVIRLVKNEGIKWSEENPGSIMIKLASQRQKDYFNFVDREVYAT